MREVKIKEAFVLRRICGYNIVVPIGKNVKDFQGALLLNKTSAIIFEQLQEGKCIQEIAKVITKEYDVTIPIVLKDIKELIESLKKAGIIDMDDVDGLTKNENS